MKATIFLRNIILKIGFILLSLSSYSQESTGGIPLSWQDSSLLSNFKTNQQVISLPNLNNQLEQYKADSISAINCIECKSNYYGKGIDVAIDIKNQGLMQVFEDGSKIWLLKIQSATALGMQFYFDKFHLPEGAELYIFKEDSTMLLGAFTSINNPKDSTKTIKFGTQIIDGNSIIIEYHEPSNVSFGGELSVTKIIHVFNESGLKSGPFGSSDPCNVNVSCPEGSGWQNEINSVVLILGYDNNNNLSAVCSGALINNTAQDGRAFFLTANHCIDGNIQQNSLYDYSTWLFLFNHQTPICSSDGSDVSSYTGQSVYGSALLERDGVGSPTSDYLLLELNAAESTLASYGACYAGWTLLTLSNSINAFTGIHHPKGDVKKLSVSSGVVISSTLQGQNNPSGNYWKLNWGIGITQPGSSGSPLFDVNHKIVGQLWGGNGLCAPNGISLYGKFSKSWQNGGFSFWLDPLNTHQASINTYCPNSGGGGSGGGGYQNPFIQCFTNLSRDGFYINNKLDLVTEVCPDNIVIKAFNSNPSVCDFGFFNIHYGKIFISMTLVDDNLVPRGPEFAKWVEVPSSHSFNLAQSYTVGSITIRPYLPSPYIILQSGQTYRVKIATGVWGWQEHTKYIHIYEDNRTLNGVNITSNVYGKNITILNSTVTQPIEVVASESIIILPNSTLNLGTYRIDEGLNCNSFMRVGVPNNNTYSKGASNNSSFQYDKTFENTNEYSESNINDKVHIFPNPTSNNINITQLNNFVGGNIEIINLMGQVIFTTTINTNQLSADLSKHPKGIYLIKISSDREQVIEKIVLE